MQQEVRLRLIDRALIRLGIIPPAPTKLSSTAYYFRSVKHPLIFALWPKRLEKVVHAEGFKHAWGIPTHWAWFKWVERFKPFFDPITYKAPGDTICRGAMENRDDGWNYIVTEKGEAIKHFKIPALALLVLTLRKAT